MNWEAYKEMIKKQKLKDHYLYRLKWRYMMERNLEAELKVDKSIKQFLN